MESGCRRSNDNNRYGPYVWTGGQSFDLNNPSDFMWKLVSYPGAVIWLGVSDVLCPVKYTNWATKGKTPGYNEISTGFVGTKPRGLS